VPTWGITVGQLRCEQTGNRHWSDLNPAFQLKAALVAAGLTNGAIYEFWAKCTVERLASGASMPARAKVAGVLSLGIWVAVAACGRSIAYF
jgi:hypothetical protein